jgi:inorganic triphosphatase YgiF
LPEVENALLILAKDNEIVEKIINDLFLRKRYHFEKKGRRTMTDMYFDYKDKSLKKHKIDLRIRSTEGEAPKITLKVLKRITSSHSERVEIERIWSRESFDEIIKELSSHLRGHTLESSGNFVNEDPENILTRVKFVKIQERKTERNIINAINSHSGELEFEFAIDRTFYRLNSSYKDYGLMELEIESKKIGNYENLDRLVNEIIAEHQSKFLLWSHSKLATGLAIETLLSRRNIKTGEDFDNDGLLTLSGAKKIESFMKLEPG